MTRCWLEEELGEWRDTVSGYGGADRVTVGCRSSERSDCGYAVYMRFDGTEKGRVDCVEDYDMSEAAFQRLYSELAWNMPGWADEYDLDLDFEPRGW